MDDDPVARQVAQQARELADLKRQLAHEREMRELDLEHQLAELARRHAGLTEAYTELWQQHQECPRGRPEDTPQRPWGGDAYAVLGVRADAEPEAIEAPYKALAKKYHPDRHPGDPRADARMEDQIWRERLPAWPREALEAADRQRAAITQEARRRLGLPEEEA
jgi:DnaJ-domain-containing protein 1